MTEHTQPNEPATTFREGCPVYSSKEAGDSPSAARTTRRCARRRGPEPGSRPSNQPRL